MMGLLERDLAEMDSEIIPSKPGEFGVNTEQVYTDVSDSDVLFRISTDSHQ